MLYHISDMKGLLSFSLFYFYPGARRQAVMVLGISPATTLPTEGRYRHAEMQTADAGEATVAADTC